jgi:hypothetical protein
MQELQYRPHGDAPLGALGFRVSPEKWNAF